MTGRLACRGAMLLGGVLGLAGGRLGAGEAIAPAPDDPVRVTVADVGIDPATQGPFVLLETEKKDRLLLIVVGPAEAMAIASELRGGVPPRPMTHDLLRSVIAQLGATLQRVIITRIERGTFYGELLLRRQDGAALRIDSRPSDAIALALRARAPVFVARRVLDEVGIAPGQLPRREAPAPEPPRKRPVDPDWAI